MARQTAATRSWSTSLTIGTFLFTGLSGVMLFLHFAEGLLFMATSTRFSA
jgi:hypothetical protein